MAVAFANKRQIARALVKVRGRMARLTVSGSSIYVTATTSTVLAETIRVHLRLRHQLRAGAMAVRFTIATASIITMSIFIPMMAETPGITLTASMPDAGITCERYAARIARNHLYP